MIMTPSHNEFYIPTLHILSDVEPRHISLLIKNVIDTSCRIDKPQNSIVGAGETPGHELRIRDAVTALLKEGLIELLTDDVYLITIEGLEFLEAHDDTMDEIPETPPSPPDPADGEEENLEETPDIDTLASAFIKAITDVCETHSIGLHVSVEYRSKESWRVTIGDRNVALNFKAEIPIADDSGEEYPETQSLEHSDQSSSNNSLELSSSEEEKPAKPAIVSTGVWFKPNSQITFAIYGDTEPFAELFKSYGGYYSSALKNGGGWVFLSYREKDLAKDLKEYIIPDPTLNALVTKGSKTEVSSKKTGKVDSASRLTQQMGAELKKYTNLLQSMKQFNHRGMKGPFKAILLIAIFDMIHSHRIIDPKIYFTNELEDRYDSMWKKYMGHTPGLNAAYAFVRLGEEPFFRHQVFRPIYNYNISWDRTILKDYIHCGVLDHKLYSLLRNNTAYESLMKLLDDLYCHPLPPELQTSPKSLNSSGDSDGIKTKSTTPLHGRKVAFISFLENKGSDNGSSINPKSITAYANALNNQWVRKMLTRYQSSGNIYDITDPKILRKAEKIISDAVQSGIIPAACRTAMNHYQRFFNEYKGTPLIP